MSFPPWLQVPGAQLMPANTTISAVKLVVGQTAQCIGRFPVPPAGFALPGTFTKLFANPTGGKCAGQFNSFYQAIGPDGTFVTQCAP
jgi:hypothetical protein